MTGLLEGFRRLLAVIGAVERSLVILLIFTIVASIGTQVVTRYVFNLPLVWVEELATYSFVWATFVGASLGLKLGRHIKIETFVSRLGPGREALFRVLGYAAILCLAVIIMKQAWIVSGIESRRSSISLPIDLPVSLFFSIPLLVSMASMALTAVYLAAEELHRIAKGTRLPPILPPLVDDTESGAESEAETGAGPGAGKTRP